MPELLSRCSLVISGLQSFLVELQNDYMQSTSCVGWPHNQPAHKPDNKQLTSAKFVTHFIHFSTIDHIHDYVVTALKSRSDLVSTISS
jgi:hypothetical protein